MAESLTIGQLFQRSKERISELNAACDSITPGTPEFDEATGRYEEAKVWGELIATVLISDTEERHEAVIDRSRAALDEDYDRYDPNRC